MKFLERILENPARFARLKRLFHIGLGVLVLIEVLLPRIFHGGHAHFAFEDIPGWGALYGLISTVVIILVSKFIGHAGLMRKEDFYD